MQSEIETRVLWYLSPSSIKDTAQDPSLARIEDAFSVEAVTKEFFTRYRLLFEDINAALEKLLAKDKALNTEFSKKGVNSVDFAKKLMGQIVFLYFLQKKGWLGVAKGQDWGAGPHDFLRRLASLILDGCLIEQRELLATGKDPAEYCWPPLFQKHRDRLRLAEKRTAAVA